VGKSHDRHVPGRQVSLLRGITGLNVLYEWTTGNMFSTLNWGLEMAPLFYRLFFGIFNL
jgi:hypothetical protein